jgi:predicted ABC-type ATPase
VSERQVVILAGPNGAGKTTAASGILPRFNVLEFVNADTIARGLSAFSPESVSIAADRIMLERLKQLGAQGQFRL